MDALDLTKYQSMVLRRKYWIIIPFLLFVLAGLSYYMLAPKIYESETLILVQPQKVPEDYVRSIVSTSIEDRLRTISQQVTSRTNLEKIIEEFNLFKNERGALAVEEMVLDLRERIRIERAGGRNRETSTFSIAFRGENPETVMKVTNALSSNFISENLRIREDQALGTSVFLADELKAVEKRLMEKEDRLKEYRERYMGGLPEQLNSNLSVLDRLQQQLSQLHDTLRDTENRKIAIRAQISEMPGAIPSIPGSPATVGQETRDIQSLKKELMSAKARYTDMHPDVKRLEETIAAMEREITEAVAETGPDSDEVLSLRAGIDPDLRRQLQDIDVEIAGLKEEIKQTQTQIAAYQRKVEETPKREQELFSLNRDYNNEKELYNSLLNRKLEAEIAVSMEMKQKGEQFRVIDPAKIAVRPIEPNLMKTMLLTLMLGLGLGGGLAYLKEMMDTSYMSPEELEEDVKIPVLASMPFIYTEREQRDRKVREILKVCSVSAAFLLFAIGVLLAREKLSLALESIRTFLL
jgi:polysaccharide chain length determinant protein (PEP-CTERM system associated)